jgi:hypothetical protein
MLDRKWFFVKGAFIFLNQSNDIRLEHHYILYHAVDNFSLLKHFLEIFRNLEFTQAKFLL